MLRSKRPFLSVMLPETPELLVAAKPALLARALAAPLRAILALDHLCCKQVLHIYHRFVILLNRKLKNRNRTHSCSVTPSHVPQCLLSGLGTLSGLELLLLLSKLSTMSSTRVLGLSYRTCSAVKTTGDMLLRLDSSEVSLAGG